MRKILNLLIKLAALAALLVGAISMAGEVLPKLSPSITLFDTNGQNPVSSGNIGSTPNWYGFQWQNPSTLLAVTAPADSSTWETTNAYSRIKYYSSLSGSTDVYELASADIPCTTGPYSQSAEQDIFLQTPAGTYGNPVLTNTPISNTGQVWIAVKLSVPYSTLRQGCQHNFSVFAYSIVLSSTTGQALYAQIELGNTTGKVGSFGWCPDYISHDTEGFANQFCFTDSIVNYGGTHVTPYATVQIGVDVLPRLLNIIKNGVSKTNGKSLDTDPSHWMITAVYFGMINYGQQITTSQWSDISLNNLLGGTFCSDQNTITQWSCESLPKGDGWLNVGGSCYHRNTKMSC